MRDLKDEEYDREATCLTRDRFQSRGSASSVTLRARGLWSSHHLSNCTQSILVHIMPESEGEQEWMMCVTVPVTVSTDLNFCSYAHISAE